MASDEAVSDTLPHNKRKSQFMKNHTVMVEPLCIPFLLEEKQIESRNEVVRDAHAQVMSGKIVILKQAFEAEEMARFKAKIIQWGDENDVFPHGQSPSKFPELNYHRIDDGSVPSVCPHLFHQYGFNNINALKPEYKELFNKVTSRLVCIQNAIGNTSFGVSLTGLRLKVIQYPEGGGFLAEHTHPLEPQKIGLILSLSRRKMDFTEGAAVFTTPEGNVDTASYHDIGDVAIFRYDLPHAVSKVNPYIPSIDWKKDTGKWSVVLELRETHGLSHNKN